MIKQLWNLKTIELKFLRDFITISLRFHYYSASAGTRAPRRHRPRFCFGQKARLWRGLAIARVLIPGFMNFHEHPAGYQAIETVAIWRQNNSLAPKRHIDPSQLFDLFWTLDQKWKLEISNSFQSDKNCGVRVISGRRINEKGSARKSDARRRLFIENLIRWSFAASNMKRLKKKKKKFKKKNASVEKSHPLKSSWCI